jgi:predicted MPP superfamily phosphohydrolase
MKEQCGCGGGNSVEAGSPLPYRRWRRPVVSAALMALGDALCHWKGTPKGIPIEAVRRWRERVVVRKSLGQKSRLRVAFASDLHAGRLTPTGTIVSACEALMEAAPDLILLGGDFVCRAGEELQAILPAVGRLRAPCGVFAVMGNHDHSAGAALITRRLEDCGVGVLCNRSVKLPDPFGNVLLVGLDDHLGGKPRAADARWDPSCATLLLIHQPSGLLDAGDRPFDVALAGHTHGGQITLPWGIAPLAASGPLSRMYRAGRFGLPEGRVLCVSVGVGHSLLPIRLGPRTEVLFLELVGLAKDTTPALETS